MPDKITVSTFQLFEMFPAGQLRELMVIFTIKDMIASYGGKQGGGEQHETICN